LKPELDLMMLPTRLSKRELRRAVEWVLGEFGGREPNS
jgi:hypothetical protein